MIGDRAPGRLADYVALARPAHWVKHLFILPGIVLALLLHGGEERLGIAPILLGLAAAAAAASANYVLNEWLDARTDAHHSFKASRPAVSRRLSPATVWFEYVALAALSLTLGLTVSPLFALTVVVFLLSGVAYNVRPLRTKDHAYLDVISESFNNPIRLTLGWAMVDTVTLPPSSVLGAYWMGGAFLMAIKRLAELRSAEATGRRDGLGLYRRSFRVYTEESLLISSLVYAQLAGFFLAVFLVKYRIEYLLALPFVAALFGVYLRVGLADRSRAERPETLLADRGLWLVVVLLVAALVVLTWLDLPLLDRLTDPHYIRLPFAAGGQGGLRPAG